MNNEDEYEDDFLVENDVLVLFFMRGVVGSGGGR